MSGEDEDIRRFCSGEAAAFEQLVIRYRVPAIRFAQQLTGDYYTAEDLAQECFAYLFVYPDKFDFRASFKTYLFTLIRNKSIDYLRKHRRSSLVGEWDGDRTADTSSAGNPEKRMLAQEESRELERNLMSLKKEYRTAVYLVDLEELSYGEAAAVMAKNPVAFKVLLHRARKKLKQRYEEEDWNDETDTARPGISR